MTNREAQIQQAAIDLFLTEGVGVSTARIAKVAGVSNGTLFNTFATKQDLIDAVHLSAKTQMMAAVGAPLDQDFDRAGLHDLWTGYLGWSRSHPKQRQAMHLLLDGGLVSDKAAAAATALSAPHIDWISAAYSKGLIRGPSVAFICALIFRFLDLVLDQNIEGEDEDLAFTMLHETLGLTQ